jgi:phosphoglycolate phosphatase-like HAD superfamily hydrolase
MVLLLDLDGTLTDTAHEKFKPLKDGLKDFEVSEIPVFPGAVEFVKSLIKSHFIIIVSDSHPNYVNKIASEIFGLEVSNSNVKINDSEIVGSLSQVVYLADKPNTEKTFNHLSSYAHELDPHCPMIHLKDDKDEFLMIGDSWLDIELGRRLNIRTVLTQFYKATSIEERDGIGQDWKPIKMGPTYYAKTYNDLTKIIENPNKELLSLEAIFQNENSDNMVKFLYRNYNGNFTAFRCLARQDDGECDRFARADKYYQIDNPERSREFISMLAQSVSNYLSRVEKFPQYQWDYLTYVSDKKTTSPPNKMKEIFDLINSGFNKIKIFEWSNDVEGSLRNQPNYQTRRDFISKYLMTIEGIDLNGKSVIVIDDQFTSSATANEISQQLRNKGVKNILFVALFYLILPIESKLCPNIINGQVCGKPLKIKINKKNGNKFYSCLPPQYRGTGCGYIENIAN